MTAAFAPAAASAAVAAAVAPAAAMVDELYVGLGGADIFLVEDIERRQADIRDFLFTKSEVVILSGVKRGYPHLRTYGYGGCAARHRQRQPGGSQHREGFPVTLSF